MDFNDYFKKENKNSIKDTLYNLNNEIINKTDDNSIIFTVLDDGLFLGNRRTCYYAMIPEEYHKQEIKRLTSELNRDGITVYLFRPKKIPYWWYRSGYYNFDIDIEKISDNYEVIILSNNNYELYKLK